MERARRGRRLSASLEDYVEAIFRIVSEKRVARARDIAKRLRVKSSSVTGALRSLASRDLVNYAPYDVITLTEEGERIARDIVKRHETLLDFLVNILAVEEGEAEEAACRLEHAAPRPIMDRLTRFVDFIRTCPRAGAPLIDGFRDHCESGSDVRRCGECLADLCGPPSADAGESRSSGESFALAAMVPGQRARIERVPVRPGAPARLADMGVAPGAVLEVERTGPGGDPLYVLVNGYHLSIRRGEAKDILLRAL